MRNPTPQGRAPARAFGFAHLMGLGGKKAEEEEKDPNAEDPEKDPDAEDPEKEPDAEDPEKDKDAEDPEKDPDAEGDDDDVNAENPDDDDETKGRKAERRRGAAIFSCPAAALRPDMAADLAFNSDLSVKAATRMLTNAAAGHNPRKGLGARMSAAAIPALGAAPAPASGARGRSDLLADRIVAAGKKRRGEA